MQGPSVDFIRKQNDVLLLAAKRETLLHQVNDRKDLMRKLREKQVTLDHSTYCFVGGVAVKKKSQQVYPVLEREVGRLSKVKEGVHKQLISELAGILQMLKEKVVGGSEVDYQIKDLLTEFECDLLPQQ